MVEDVSRIVFNSTAFFLATELLYMSVIFTNPLGWFFFWNTMIWYLDTINTDQERKLSFTPHSKYTVLCLQVNQHGLSLSHKLYIRPSGSDDLWLFFPYWFPIDTHFLIHTSTQASQDYYGVKYKTDFSTHLPFCLTECCRMTPRLPKQPLNLKRQPVY